MKSLKQQGRFADARITTNQNNGTGYHSTSQNAIQFHYLG
jgi:hypothetical protein